MYTRTLAVLNFAFYNGIYAIDVASSAPQEEILSQVDIERCPSNYSKWWREAARACGGDGGCRKAVAAEFDQKVCECDPKWVITWKDGYFGYGASYSSANPDRDCGGGAADPASESTPEPDTPLTPDTPEPDTPTASETEEAQEAQTPAGAADWPCDSAPPLDWGLVDPAANGEGSLTEECRNLNFQLRQLEKHNEYRARHGADPLEYDPSLAAKAQEYAKHLADIGRMEHDPKLKGLGQGENLAWRWSSREGASEQTNIYTTSGLEAWYDEVTEHAYFDRFEKNGRPPPYTGHFTQVVWKATEKLGCGTEGDYLVCRYYPAGNNKKHYPDYREYEANVGPLQ